MTTPTDLLSDLDLARADLRERLCDADLLLAGPVPGQYGRGATFSAAIDAVARLVVDSGARHLAEAGKEGSGPSSYRELRYPPVFPREQFEKTDYIASFPDLTGTISTFTGGDREHAALLADRSAGLPWDHHLAPTDSALVPATCHPTYARFAGTLPEGGAATDVRGWAFRHEPSGDPMRMQAFQMQELVRIATPDVVLEHQRVWVDRGLEILDRLGLDAHAEAANDPFFGRAGRILAAGQREESLKTELVVRVYGDEHPGTALASSNNHQDHFGHAFGIHTADGEVAHSTCVGFGLERVAVALFAVHGTDPARWPARVRGVVGG